eukprot:CAMPEP_0196575774 /NCGR_PEP_ID=MMETSP1081-20130531/5184_1 /TAXON_ID=36882 /ORGANISM="Pyramimonas amylifera, Strain CCMP720" /LENGTH=232 /DNA_ID=CAMNT_0041894177 /DNA_START=239 /DNA_END=937 /DNA_ORIENTATION=-
MGKSDIRKEEIDTKLKAEANLQRKIIALKSPAKLQAQSFAKTLVTDAGGEVGVIQYINLPPEEYTSEIFPGGEIRRVSGDLFTLEVPKVQVMQVPDIWIRPTMKVVVIPPSDTVQKVQLIALDCAITGSDIIKSMNLDNRFAMRMETYLEYHPAQGSEQARLETTANLDVWCEIIPPFNFMPKSALESATSGVVGAVMSAMLNVFNNKVAADYQRWSTDSAYRITRKSIVPK